MSAARRALGLIGSPKGSRSTSESLGAYLLDRLLGLGLATETIPLAEAVRSPEGVEELLGAVARADLVILSFPLYCDSLPWAATRALERIAAQWGGSNEPANGPRLAAIVNSGFPEARHSDTALAICRRFAAEAGFAWSGGLALGGGGTIGGRPLDTLGGVARNVRRALDMTASALAEGLPVPREAVDLMARPLAPRWLYLLIGNLGWRWQARRHGVSGRLNDRPYA